MKPEDLMTHKIDRTGWAPGPWDTEPDRADWDHVGLPCFALRNQHGNWCGYAGVTAGHPLYGVPYGQSDSVLTTFLDRLKERQLTNEELTMPRMLAMLSGEVTTAPDVVLDVHGGLTYSGACSPPICHVPRPVPCPFCVGRLGVVCTTCEDCQGSGEVPGPDDVWWFGFDCGHAFDMAPGLEAMLRKHRVNSEIYGPDFDTLGGSYKTLDYVKAEVNKLAEQLKEVGGAGNQSPLRIDADAGLADPAESV